MCVFFLACRSNPIGDVISLLQIEVVGVGRRRDAGWCRSELQCVSVEQIHHGCRLVVPLFLSQIFRIVKFSDLVD